MKRMQQNAIIMAILVVGSIIGAVKGQEAKQKWMFKVLSKQEERQSRAVRKMEARKGKVLLDDIEMSAYHKS